MWKDNGMKYKHIKITFKIPVIDDEFDITTKINQFLEFFDNAVRIIFNTYSVHYEVTDKE